MTQLQASRRPFATVLLLVLALVLSARAVGARSYSLDEVVVSARVGPDGSLWIDETRTYTYDGRYSWAEFRLPLDRVRRVSDFSLTEGERVFTPASGDEPGTYRLASSDDELHVRWHYVAEDETRSFRLRYRIGAVVDLHADVAEFYYQFVGVINPQAIGRVEVELELPRAAVFDEVRAWAHGPLHGGVDFQDTGRLSFDVAPLPARQMWEARVTFPVDWMAAAPVRGRRRSDARSHPGRGGGVGPARPTPVRERARSAAQAQAASNRTAGRIAGVLAVLRVAGGGGGPSEGRAGPHQVDYGQRIDSTLPDEAPAVASYLYHGKQVNGDALGATLFDLARRGFVRMEPDPQPKKWYESGPMFTIRLDRGAWRGRSETLQRYERSLIEFLFDGVAEGRDSLHSREVHKAQGKMQKWFEAWKPMVRAAAGDRTLLRPGQHRARRWPRRSSPAESWFRGHRPGHRHRRADGRGRRPGRRGVRGALPHDPPADPRGEAAAEEVRGVAALSEDVPPAPRGRPGRADRRVPGLRIGAGGGVQADRTDCSTRCPSRSGPRTCPGTCMPTTPAHRSEFADAMTSIVAAATTAVSSSAGAGGGGLGGRWRWRRWWWRRCGLARPYGRVGSFAGAKLLRRRRLGSCNPRPEIPSGVTPCAGRLRIPAMARPAVMRGPRRGGCAPEVRIRLVRLLGLVRRGCEQMPVASRQRVRRGAVQESAEQDGERHGRFEERRCGQAVADHAPRVQDRSEAARAEPADERHRRRSQPRPSEAHGDRRHAYDAEARQGVQPHPVVPVRECLL